MNEPPKLIGSFPNPGCLDWGNDVRATTGLRNMGINAVAELLADVRAALTDAISLTGEQRNTSNQHRLPEIAIQRRQGQRLAHRQLKILGVVARQAVLTGGRCYIDLNRAGWRGISLYWQFLNGLQERGRFCRTYLVRLFCVA